MVQPAVSLPGPDGMVEISVQGNPHQVLFCQQVSVGACEVTERKRKGEIGEEGREGEREGGRDRDRETERKTKTEAEKHRHTYTHKLI
jgi:hypothetical protein